MTFFTALTQWHWLIASVILLILEISVSTGGFLLWLGISALGVSLIVWTLPSMDWRVQLLLFSAIAVIVSFAWRTYLKRYPIQTDDPKLNRRTEQYIGRIFILLDPIQNGRGKIQADGTIWTVSGPDLPANTSVKVTGADGAVLIAEKAKA